jgi:hypothetical protein
VKKKKPVVLRKSCLAHLSSDHRDGTIFVIPLNLLTQSNRARAGERRKGAKKELTKKVDFQQ